ncbi:protein FAM210A-like [Paramacrobiotus metropolitanus]|uniref:protein FAM210A-like n=1 Tax=Paramacrobiotus metropolitanus TaxID=2943436 RepID=UPI0024461A4E|nr:protein FAM210A-like [Paramacrobiotus metropolitanus]XP_055352439.1 protein FAM210A-like [Paramacrobiotus metropolitanus]
MIPSSNPLRLFQQMDLSSFLTSSLYWNTVPGRLLHALQKPQFAVTSFQTSRNFHGELRAISPTSNCEQNAPHPTPIHSSGSLAPQRTLLGPRWSLLSHVPVYRQHTAYFCTTCGHFRHFHVEKHDDRRRMMSKSVEGRAQSSNEVRTSASTSPASPMDNANQKTVFDPHNQEADQFYALLEKGKRNVRRRDPDPAPTIAEEQLRKESGADAEGLAEKAEEEGNKKVTLWTKFKDMYKKYWYVLLPVHGVLCVTWYGGFYFLASRGVDVIPMLEKMGVSETWIGYIRKSGAGHLAAAFAMYKLATPLRYSVTLGATTVAINYLTKRGYIKPVPSAAKIKEMIKDRGEKLKVLSRRGRRRLSRIRDKYGKLKKDAAPNGKIKRD